VFYPQAGHPRAEINNWLLRLRQFKPGDLGSVGSALIAVEALTQFWQIKIEGTGLGPCLMCAHPAAASNVWAGQELNATVCKTDSFILMTIAG
jgi:hypothetical protein